MAFNIHWPRLLRRALRVFATLLGLVIIGWLGLAWYVSAHKKEILSTLTKELGQRMRGELRISDMEPSLLRSFPFISLSLRQVSLRDSLWAQHRHSLLESENMYVRVSPFALISHRVEIKKITATHGSIFLYTDTSGYSNAYMLARRDTSKKNRPALVDYFALEDMHFWFVNDAKQKLFHILIKELEGSSSRSQGVITTRIAASTYVHGMAFSTIRGAYLEKQDLDFNLTLNYYIADKHLSIPQQEVSIAHIPIGFAGDFYFNRTPAAFAIRLSAKEVPYKTALSWTSENIRRTLQPYDFAKPVALKIDVSGEMKYHTIPLIRIVYPINDNTLITPLGRIEHVTYQGAYYNEAAAGHGHGDDNSYIAMYRLKGEWHGIPFRSDTLLVTNLLKPVVNAHLQSEFPVKQLNGMAGGSVLAFMNGNAAADLHYKGAILTEDTVPHTINGFVRISDAEFDYLPRNLAFSNVNATLLFEGDNLFFRNVTMRNKRSSLDMEGDALHFLRLYFSDPGKATIAWRIRGPFVNLNDYIGLVAKRRRIQTPQPRTNAVTRVGYQLDRVLDEASFSLDAHVDRVLYKSFVAEDVVAKATIAQSGITLEEAKVRNGGGTLTISATVNQSAADNPFHIRSQVRNANVSKLFASCNNFGQKAISSSNLEGLIQSDIDVSGKITDAGAIIENSFYGSVSFRLDSGAINHFGPFEKIGRFIFKKRNLSAVAVKDLEGQLDVRGAKILIRPMTIKTSALNISVQGVYGLNGGTDIYVAVPLRNPEKEGAKTPVGMILRAGKGIVVHLRAQDPDGSGVKLGWDPMRHGRKATEEALEVD